MLVLVTAACGARIDPPTAASVGSVSAPAGAGAGTSEAIAPEESTGGTDSAALDAGSAPAAVAGADPAGGASDPNSSGRATPGGGASSPAKAGVPTAGGGPVAGTQPGQPAAGGSTGGGASATGTPPAATADPPDAVRISGRNSQGVSDTEIKVGVLAPLSGAAGFLGELEVDSIKAFLADANARGGVRGRRYRIVTADTRFEPPTEATAARRLVEEEKVFALFSLLGDTTAQYATTRGIPTIVYGGNPVSFSSKYPTVYPVGWNMVGTNASFAYILTQVLKLPIKTVAVTYETTNVPWGPWADYGKKAWEAFGVEVKTLDRFNLSDGDCTQLVLKVRNLDVDFWYLGSLGWPLCQSAMARQNYTPKHGRGGPMTDDINFSGQVGQAADGLYAMTNRVQVFKDKGQPWLWNDGKGAPEVDRFVGSMRKFSPKSANEAGLEALWSQSFWSAAKLLHDGLSRQVDALTWQGFNQWTQTQRNWNSGLVAPASFDPKCKTGAMALWIFQYKWADGKIGPADWQPYGGFHQVPESIMDKIIHGAGKCYLTAMADAKL